jgi:hypothetical protein
MSIYIQYSSAIGLPSPSSSEGWMEIFQFSLGAANPISTSTGTGLQGGKSDLSGLNIKKPPPYSLTSVKIINTLLPHQPSSGRQPRPNTPRAAPPVPPWLRLFLGSLRPRMRALGTVHVGGFHFDEKELSSLVGVPVRELR